MTNDFDYYQLKRSLCRDAAEILRAGAEDQDSVLYKVWKRQNYCQVPLADNVFIARADGGRVTRKLLKYCEKRTCPWCIELIVSLQKASVEAVCAEWRARGGSWLFATFTIPHDKISLFGDGALELAKAHFRECDALLEAVWRAFSRYYRSTADVSWISHCRKSEATFGGPSEPSSPQVVSYHTHLHVLIASQDEYKLVRRRSEGYRVYTKRQAEANLAVSRRLYDAWARALAAALKRDAARFPSIIARQESGRIVLREPFVAEIQKTIRDKKGRRRKLKVFVCKGAVTAEAPYGNDTAALERYLAAEVTYSHRKRGKGHETYSWLEGLERFPNETWYRMLYRHWVERIHRFEDSFGKKNCAINGVDCFLDRMFGWPHFHEAGPQCEEFDAKLWFLANNLYIQR